MGLKKLKVFIVVLFLGIFVSKMIISAAPVFLAHIDQQFMISVIMQLENENHGDENGKSSVKFVDQKLITHRYEMYTVSIDLDCGVPSSFIEHSRRYVDPYYPSVPTPPPNNFI